MRDGQVNESFITGYKVTVVDGCGLPLEVPGGTSFRYLPKHGAGPSCCSEQAYSLIWALTLPTNYSHFMVVPYSDEWGEQDAGLLIRIADAGDTPSPLPSLRGVSSGAAPLVSWTGAALAVGAALLSVGGRPALLGVGD